MVRCQNRKNQTIKELQSSGSEDFRGIAVYEESFGIYRFRGFLLVFLWDFLYNARDNKDGVNQCYKDFQNMYFSNSFPEGFGVTPKPELCNYPELLISKAERDALGENEYILEAAKRMAEKLNLFPTDI